MSLADVEIVMDGQRTVRIIVSGKDLPPVQLPGVAEMELVNSVGDVNRLVVTFLVGRVEVRQAHEGEL